MRYSVVDEHGREDVSFDQIMDCQEWIAERFGVPLSLLGGCATTRRQPGSFGAYQSPNGAMVREIVRALRK